MTVPKVELPNKCPKCGSSTIFGYGLAGGSIGPYVMCDGTFGDCDFFQKKVDNENTRP